MKSIKDISGLNWALEVYSDIIRFKLKSDQLENFDECLRILIDFEEYEKCYDLYKIIKNEK
jgi:hypothetical protein